MNKQINILFLGGAKRVSLAEHFIKWGESHNLKINIFSYELSEQAPIMEVAQIIVGLKWKDENIFNHLKKVIAEHQINIVLPFVDPATLICSKFKENDIPVFCPVSDSITCDIFFSKIKTQEWCDSNNILVPAGSTSEFPIIAKPDNGSASQGIQIITNKIEFDNLVKNENSQKYLFQKFIDANEYTVDIYRSVTFNNVNYLVPRIRLEVQGGEAIKAKTIKHQEIAKFAKDILEKSNLIGAITLQFLEDKKTGTIYFMEANPRFGGGVVTSIGAGIDIADFVLNDYYRIYCDENENWENNLIMMRRFKEIYIHATNH